MKMFFQKLLYLCQFCITQLHRHFWLFAKENSKLKHFGGSLRHIQLEYHNIFGRMSMLYKNESNVKFYIKAIAGTVVKSLGLELL